MYIYICVYIYINTYTYTHIYIVREERVLFWCIFIIVCFVIRAERYSGWPPGASVQKRG